MTQKNPRVAQQQIGWVPQAQEASPSLFKSQNDPHIAKDNFF